MAVVDPFKGLIDGVLQGHAIATQLHHQALQDEAFQRAQERDQREAQLKDIETQMMLGQNARPVQAGAVQDFLPAAPEVAGQPSMQGGNPQIPIMRPVDKSRRVSYKGANGQTQDYELLSPEEQMQKHLDSLRGQGVATAQGAGMAEGIKKQFEQQFRQQALKERGVPAPDIIVQAGFAQPGEMILPEEKRSWLPEAKKLLTPETKEVSAGSSLVQVPGPSLGTSGGTAPGEPAKPTTLFTAPEKPSGDFEKIYLPAFALKHGKTPDKLGPDLTLQAFQEYAQRGKDPGMQNLAKALTQAHLDDLRARQTTKSAPIEPGTREFRIAQDLAYGKLTMQQFRSLTAYSRDTNKKMDIYDKASELNPNFNPAQFEMGFKFAANPKSQQQLASMDNVAKGAADLLRLSDLASRSGVTTLNKFVIPGGIAIGNKKYSNFHAAWIAFADELSGALGFGSATDMSRQMGLDMTNPNLTTDAFRSAVETVVLPFVERKRKSMLDQMGVYGQPGMNPGAPSTATPAAGGNVEKWGFDAKGNLVKQ